MRRQSSAFALMLALLAHLALFALTAAAQGSPVAFRVCPGKSDRLGITAVSVGTAKASTRVAINAQGRSQLQVAKGTTVRMALRQNGMNAPVKVYDFCTAIQPNGGTCPLRRNTNFNAAINHDVSKWAKPGVATATVTVLDASGAEISCITTNITVSA